jgi:lipoprotein
MFMKKKKLCGLVMCFLLCTALVGCSVSEIETTDNASITEIRNPSIYEFVDKDTGVHYWIYSQRLTKGGMGGITPRLNSDGTVMTTK